MFLASFVVSLASSLDFSTFVFVERLVFFGVMVEEEEEEEEEDEVGFFVLTRRLGFGESRAPFCESRAPLLEVYESLAICVSV